MKIPVTLLTFSVRALYRASPDKYLEVAKRHWQSSNNLLLVHLFERLPEEDWPLHLWIFGNQYLNNGGLKSYPDTSRYEDVILCDAAQRHLSPGPIQDQVERFKSKGVHTLEKLGSGEDKASLARRLEPIRFRDRRLASQLDVDDLLQEALMMLQEVIETPWADWDVGKRWSPERIQSNETFMKDVVQGLSAKKYGTNRKIERIEADAVVDDSFVDPKAQEEFEQVELRMQQHSEVEDLLESSPPKQREALETLLAAHRTETSLEEKSIQMGRDPKKVLENLKAARRRNKRP